MLLKIVACAAMFTCASFTDGFQFTESRNVKSDENEDGKKICVVGAKFPRFCFCKPIYELRNGKCEVRCVENDCDKKICVANDCHTKVTCICRSIYEPANGKCEVKCEENDCDKKICVANDDHTQVTCTCKPIYELRNGKCEVPSIPCITKRCHGGTCKVENNEEICECPIGFDEIFDFCTQTKCIKRRCIGGSCYYESGEEICVCSAGYKYDSRTDTCSDSECKIRDCRPGTCYVEDGQEKCQCPDKYIEIDGTCKREETKDVFRLKINLMSVLFIVVPLVVLSLCIPICTGFLFRWRRRKINYSKL